MIEEPITPNQKHEYSVVREEKFTEEENGCVREIIKGYDEKGRLVEHGIFTTESDGTKSHVFKSVNAKGYWVGGFGMEDKDGHYLHGGQLAPEKFEG